MATSSRGGALPFIVCFGGEGYFLDRDIDRYRRTPDRHVMLLDGDGMSDSELVSICMERGFDDTPRMIIVDDAHRVKGDKALKAYIEEKSVTDTSTILVAIVRTEKLGEVWQKVGPKGRVNEYKKLKTWDDNNQVVSWIESEVKRVDRRLDPGVSDLLFRHTGGSLYKVANEIRKMCLVIPKGEKITTAHLALYIASAPAAEPHQVSDAAIEKDPVRAMNRLSVLYRTQGDEVIVPVVSMLSKAVERALVARRILDKGGSEDDIAAQIGVNPYIIKRLIPHYRKHPFPVLAKHMARLCKLDADVKGPARSKRTLVELTVLSIAS